MKFSVSSSELLKQLSLGNGAINSNPVLPILEDFLFTIKGDKLTIASTNLETTIITSISVTSDGDGQIAVPARILIDTLKALPEQPISFSVDEETNAIELKSAFGKYNMAGDSPADFPEVPKPENTDSLEISSEILMQAVNKTLFATSNDELRQAMMGVYVQIDFNDITFVATDAHKLVKYKFSNVKSDVTSSLIVPKKGLTLFKNAVTGNTPVKVSFNKSNIFFEFDESKVIIRLIDEKYPDYNAVIPKNNPNLLVLGRKDFQNSLKRIGIYANKTTNQVVLKIDDGSLTISAQDLDFSNEATEQLSCSYQGDAMTIGFNSKFLIEMLNVLESDDINLELSTPNRAGILLPSEKDDDEDLIMLVMPVMMGN